MSEAARKPAIARADSTAIDAATFVADSVASLHRSATTDRIAAITVPAPRAPVEALLGWQKRGPAALWDPPTGPSVAGVGAAFVIEVDNGDRIAQIRRRARNLWPRLAERCYPGCQPVKPRLIGGLAFSASSGDLDPWQELGAGRFILPRWTYVTDPNGGALLTLAVSPRSGADPLRCSAEAATAILTRLSTWTAPSPQSSRVLSVEQSSRAQNIRHIEQLRAAIAREECQKIVFARRSVIELSAQPNPVAVLATLGARYPDCFRFAFRAQSDLFLGATPEQLISRRGDQIATEALAGSIDSREDRRNGGADPRRALLASAKDREEHDLVVRAIVDELAPLCHQIERPPTPEIRSLRNVMHLRTPIAGRLRRDLHVLDLVELLHPTPAVGGVPTATAMRWIEELEPVKRGWYASPIGWFDGDGDGELAVALRAGLLRDRRAYLYAGAGIVADSDPEAELCETDLKQRALAGSLGAVEE